MKTLTWLLKKTPLVVSPVISAVVMPEGRFTVKPLKTNVSSGNSSWLTLFSKLRIGEAPVVAMVAGSPNFDGRGDDRRGVEARRAEDVDPDRDGWAVLTWLFSWTLT